MVIVVFLVNTLTLLEESYLGHISGDDCLEVVQPVGQFFSSVEINEGRLNEKKQRLLTQRFL